MNRCTKVKGIPTRSGMYLLFSKERNGWRPERVFIRPNGDVDFNIERQSQYGLTKSLDEYTDTEKYEFYLLNTALPVKELKALLDRKREKEQAKELALQKLTDEDKKVLGLIKGG